MSFKNQKVSRVCELFGKMEKGCAEKTFQWRKKVLLFRKVCVQLKSDLNRNRAFAKVKAPDVRHLHCFDF